MEDIILLSLFRTLLKNAYPLEKTCIQTIRFYFYEQKNQIVEKVFDFLHAGVVVDKSLDVAGSVVSKLSETKISNYQDHIASGQDDGVDAVANVIMNGMVSEWLKAKSLQLQEEFMVNVVKWK